MTTSITIKSPREGLSRNPTTKVPQFGPSLTLLQPLLLGMASLAYDEASSIKTGPVEDSAKKLQFDELDDTQLLQALFAAVRVNNTSFIRQVLESSRSRSMRIIRKTHLDETLFHVVARYGRESVLPDLLNILPDSVHERDVVLGAENKRDSLALTEAILQGHTNIVNTLLEHHYKKDGQQPTEMSRIGLKYALKYAVIVDDKNIVEKLMEDSGQDLLEGKYDEFLLQLAVTHGSWNVLEIVYKYSTNREPVDKDGNNLFHLAIINGKWSERWPQGTLAIINEPNHNGNTPLHMAVNLRNAVSTEWLLGQKLINGNAKNDLGLTFLDVAKESHFSDEVRKILKGKKKLGKGRKDDDFVINFDGDDETKQATPRENGVKKMFDSYSNLLPWMIAACFTTILTVPGAFNAAGLPNMLKDPVFKACLISVAIAMGSALISIISIVSGKDLTFFKRTFKVQMLALFTVRIAYLAFLTTYALIVHMMLVPTWLFILVCCILGASFIFDLVIWKFGKERE